MSTRANLPPFLVLTNASMATSQTTAVTSTKMYPNVYYQAVWSAGATPIGTITVEVSADYALNVDGSVKNVGTWNAIYFSVNGAPASNSAPVTGNTGSGSIDIETSAPWIRLHYERTSGSGTLNVSVSGKVS